MQATLVSLTNPRWADAEHTRIECDIVTSQFPGELLPFTANPHDVEPHGRGIFEDIVAGKYGPIAEYVAPEPQEPPPPLPQPPVAE